MKQLRARLTYANVISTLALFIALGGATAFAATQLPKNSVGSPQIKKNAVKTGDIAPNAVRVGKLAPEAAKAGKIAKNAITTDRIRANAVTGSKVKDGSLQATDFAPGQLPAGPQGPQGQQGPQGEPAANLWAVVDGEGKLIRGSAGASAQQLFKESFVDGAYAVDFGEDVSECAMLATLANIDDSNLNPPDGEIGTAPRSEDPNSVFIKTLDSEGNEKDLSFHLAVFC